MASGKVEVIVTDEAGKDITFGSKTLTAEFKGKKDKKYTVAIQEPKSTRTDVGQYTVQEGQGLPPPPTDKPLVVNAGDDVIVVEGQPVILKGSAADPDNQVVRADWTQLDVAHAVARVDLVVDPTDNTDVSFTAPMIETDKEILTFQLEAENDKQEIKLDTVIVTIVSDVAPPPPKPVTGLPDLSKGTVLFDSNVVWNDGNDRTMKNHHEFDKFDPKTECAAGGHGTPRVWHVDGKGHSELSGGMSRVYNHSEHQGTIVLLQTFIFDQSLDNFSIEFFSRHNEPLPIANKTGGLQNHLKNTQVGGKYESYHASYHDLGEKTYPDGKSIKDGDEVRFALLATKDGINYEETLFIDWDHNGNYTKVYNAKYIEKENPAGAAKQPLYWRWRVNGTAPTKIKTWDVKFIQL
jgi:hypothetical protein